MPTYLEVQFKEKDQAKALGARWDNKVRRWYIPDGLDLAPFHMWLPTVSRALVDTTAFVSHSETGRHGIIPARKGITLSSLLAGVSRAVAQAFSAGVWTMVEVVEARSRNGHVYLELSERSPNGNVLAKADATIWASTAAKILPAFERATGASIAPGIKLLVHAKPVFKPQYGFSIEIDAIDPEYTLGDLEARKREIRTRLKQEGLFDANKKLPVPWDFNVVLIVAPQGAAGLGDFEAEAKRLESFGICRFIYAYSRFQGEGAAGEIRGALLAALQQWSGTGLSGPDAVAVIRGGGAANDLAWLNDYELAKTLCTLKVPVLTGIGHERDNTVLDEVANIRFDTPSKVAAGIEQVIKRRVDEARSNFELLTQVARRAANSAVGRADRDIGEILAGSKLQLENARRVSAHVMHELERQATRTVCRAQQDVRALFDDVCDSAKSVLYEARREVPAAFSEIRVEAANVVRMAHLAATGRLETIRDRVRVDILRSRTSVQQGFADVSASANRSIEDARRASKALFLEVAGQGPEKTLARGFALVRNEQKRPVTSAASVSPGAEVTIEFWDGNVTAQARDKD